MSCAYTYAITTPMKCAFGIATQIEHHNVKKAKELRLEFSRGNGRLKIWLDANWDGEDEQLKSGYVVRHNENSVVW